MTNVDDIVTGAGFARGTFYKYFDEKFDLLLALSDEAGREATAIAKKFGGITPGPDGPALLREWVSDYVDFHERYIGVVRTWLERSPSHPELDRTRECVVEAMRKGLHAVLKKFERSRPFDYRVSEVFFVALLERVPESARHKGKPAMRDEVVELIAQVIERSMFELG
jgi:AcrR family transcriptional regulator